MAVINYETEDRSIETLQNIIQHLQVIITKLTQVKADINKKIKQKGGSITCNADLEDYSSTINSMLREAADRLILMRNPSVWSVTANDFRLAPIIAVDLDIPYSFAKLTAVDATGAVSGTTSNNKYIKIESNPEAAEAGSAKPITSIFADGDKFIIEKSNAETGSGKTQAKRIYFVKNTTLSLDEDSIETVETGHHWDNTTDSEDTSLRLRLLRDADDADPV